VAEAVLQQYAVNSSFPPPAASGAAKVGPGPAGVAGPAGSGGEAMGGASGAAGTPGVSAATPAPGRQGSAGAHTAQARVLVDACHLSARRQRAPFPPLCSDAYHAAALKLQCSAAGTARRRHGILIAARVLVDSMCVWRVIVVCITCVVAGVADGSVAAEAAVLTGVLHNT